MKIKKGDNVQIMTGKDRGKSGKIIELDIKKNALVVEGFNVYKKHKKPTKQGEKGQVISVSRPMSIANVQVVCGSCGKPARVGYQLANGNKVRVCKKCKATI